MDTLLPELSEKIRDSVIRITDIRNLSRVNKKYNDLCKDRITDLEIFYKKKYDGLFLIKHLMASPLEKYTIEIILDGCYSLLTEKYYGDNPVICNMFAFVGNLELLKYAYSKSCPIDRTLYSCAAYIGHVDMLQWIVVNTKLEPTQHSLETNVVVGGHVNVLDWMLLHKMEINSAVICGNLGKYGHLCILEWLKFHKYEIKSSMFGVAARYGHLPFIIWGYENNYISKGSFYVDSLECDSLGNSAARNGHVHILDWALKHNYDIKFDDYDYKLIIKRKYINVLQWLYEHNFTFPDKIYEYIVRYDQISVLQWANDHGYKISDSIYTSEFRYGKNVLNYIIKNISITKPITINYNQNEFTTIELIIKYEKLNEDKQMRIDVLRLDFGAIELIIDKYFTTKKQFHFIINKETITLKKYGDEDDCDNQQIIYLKNDGTIQTCGFGCNDKCWWYLLMFCKNKDSDLQISIKEKINRCLQHKKYINHDD